MMLTGHEDEIGEVDQWGVERWNFQNGDRDDFQREGNGSGEGKRRGDVVGRVEGGRREARRREPRNSCGNQNFGGQGDGGSGDGGRGSMMVLWNWRWGSGGGGWNNSSGVSGIGARVGCGVGRGQRWHVVVRQWRRRWRRQ